MTLCRQRKHGQLVPQTIQVWACPECGYWRKDQSTGVHAYFPDDGKAVRHELVQVTYTPAGRRDDLDAECARLRGEMWAIRDVARRFMDRGHAGFEYDDVSEALARALQELSVIHRRADRALGGDAA